MMMVHSFSKSNEWFEDFESFAALFDAKVEVDSIAWVRHLGGVDLYLAWVKGDQKYLGA